jgi:hypothetical protein
MIFSPTITSSAIHGLIQSISVLVYKHNSRLFQVREARLETALNSSLSTALDAGWLNSLDEF